MAGKADLRKVIAETRDRRRLYNKRTILFVDEVHRWNRAQQDALLPSIETGLIILVQPPRTHILMSYLRWFPVHAFLLSNRLIMNSYQSFLTLRWRIQSGVTGKGRLK